MVKQSRHLLGLFFVVLLIVSCDDVSAGVLVCESYWTAEYKCLQHCGPCGGSSAQQPLSQADIAAWQAYALNNQGNNAVNAGNFVLAEQLFTQALQWTPGDATIASNLRGARDLQRFKAVIDQGMAAFDRKDYTDAVRSFEMANRIFPNVANVQKWLELARDLTHHGEMLDLNARGNAAFEAQDYALAVRYYEQALEKAPRLSDHATLKADLEEARKRLHADTENAARSTETNQKLGSLAASLNATKSAPGSTRNKETKGSSLDFMPASGGGSAFFGARNADPAHPPPNLPIDMQAGQPAAPGTDANASRQEKAAAGSSIMGAQSGSEENAARLAGKIFDRGGSRSDEGAAPAVSVSTPRAQPVYPPAVVLALAGDKEYQALSAKRTAAEREEGEAQRQLDDLKERQKAEPDPQERQRIQIQISDTAQKRDQAKSAGAAMDIKKEEIVKRVVYKVVIVPANETGSPQGNTPKRDEAAVSAPEKQ